MQDDKLTWRDIGFVWHPAVALMLLKCLAMFTNLKPRISRTLNMLFYLWIDIAVLAWLIWYMRKHFFSSQHTRNRHLAGCFILTPTLLSLIILPHLIGGAPLFMLELSELLRWGTVGVLTSVFVAVSTVMITRKKGPNNGIKADQ